MQPDSIRGQAHTIRDINRSLVVEIVMRSGAVSRADLARWSSLTKPTVSAIVDDLLSSGILKDAGYSRAQARNGRRARLFELDAASAGYLAIRFDSHKATVAAADARGTLRARRDVRTWPGDAGAAVAAVVDAVAGVCADGGLERHRLQAAGVAVPGVVDHATGTVALAPNLGWKEAPVHDLLAKALGMPVIVTNLSSAGAVAEGRSGVAAGVGSYVWVHVGSTVGAGIVVADRWFSRTRGFSGEIGHCWIGEGGIDCSCGMRGCLETLVSSAAIARTARAAVERGEATSLAALSEIDVAGVAHAARTGDLLSRRILEEAGTHLGIGISYLANILNPEMIVLGGHLMQFGELLLESAKRALACRSIGSRHIPLVPSTLGSDAALMGAALAAQEHSLRSYRVVTTGNPAVPGRPRNVETSAG